MFHSQTKVCQTSMADFNFQGLKPTKIPTKNKQTNKPKKEIGEGVRADNLSMNACLYLVYCTARYSKSGIKTAFPQLMQ